jgi:hypothetical protein
MHCIEYSNIKTPVVVVVVCDILELYRIRSPLQVYLGPNLILTRMQPDDSPMLVHQNTPTSPPPTSHIHTFCLLRHDSYTLHRIQGRARITERARARKLSSQKTEEEENQDRKSWINMVEPYTKEFFNVTFPAEYVAHVEINRPEKMNAFKEMYVLPSLLLSRSSHHMSLCRRVWEKSRT